MVRRGNIAAGVSGRDALALPVTRYSSGQLLLTPAGIARLNLSQQGGQSMKKVIAFFLLQSRLGASRKRVDWTTVIAWVGIAIALWILALWILPAVR
ncbi:MAG: hypothetical protein WBF73_02005 [Bradyrhizobium sp.]|jgi:hypothetical protein